MNLEFKASNMMVNEGEVYGYGSVKNVMDNVGDVILDGAYMDLDTVLEEGFFANAHDHAMPIGYFTEMREDERGLFFKAKFHSNEIAQQYKTIIEERSAAGKSITFSIGYRVLESEPGVYEEKRCRYLKKISVKEISFTLIPANEMAKGGFKKSREQEYMDLKQMILDYAQRLKAINDLGRSDGWKQDRVNELKEITENLKSIVIEIDLPEDQSVENETMGNDPGDEQKEDNLRPTQAMADAAKKGFRLHEDGKSGEGLKPETVRRANIIAERKELTEDHVVEMNAWFARHASDKVANWDKEGEETPGYVAWLLWGGDPARDWAEGKVAQMRQEEKAEVLDTEAILAKARAILAL